MKYRETRQLKISELMALLEALPQLTHLSPGWTYETTVNFRMYLKEYLRQKNRDLWINNGEISLHIKVVQIVDVCYFSLQIRSDANG